MTETGPVRLPARTLAAIAARCGRAGSGAAAALREAGREAGADLLETTGDGGDPGEAPAGEFWEYMAEALAERGLGRLQFRIRTPSLAELRLEAGPETAGERRDRPGCPFSTGLLAGIVSGAADQPVAVMEVACAVSGAEACRWLAGAEAALEEVRRRLAEDVPLEEALEAP